MQQPEQTEFIISQEYDWSAHKFEKCEKKIKTMEDLNKFLQSNQYKEYMSFVLLLQKSVTSKPISDTNALLENSENPIYEKFKILFEKLEKLCDDTELASRDLVRFGNPAFKEFHKGAMTAGVEFFKDLLEGDKKGSVIELFTYYEDCFGSNVRIDYGTGHELNFAILMLCLYKLGYFQPDEYELMVRGVFYKYFQRMLMSLGIST
jgi:serine/threonine-protein phosphatase 2A activator